MSASIRLALIGCLGGALLLLATGPAPAESWRMKVKANADITAPSFAVAELNADLPEGTLRLAAPRPLKPEASMAWVVESFRADGKTYLAFMAGPLKAGETSTHELIREESGRHSIDKAEGSRIAINWGGRPFTVYRTDEATKPFYFPIKGPNDLPFTRGYPMTAGEGEDKDHPHQRSMWFTHGNVNGFDFWGSDPLNKPTSKSGAIRETSRTIVASGSRLGVIRTTDDWLGGDGKKVCEDERTVLFSGSEFVRVIDFDITLKATAGPVTFGDTKEGMFGLRVASSMDVKRKQGGKITNAEGITDNDAWGKASPWVDYTGPVEGKTVGIAVLNHPDSFRYPTTWHVRDYGLFAANPFGWHDFGMKKSGEHTIPAGESIRFRYRVLLHTGDTPSANIPSAFNAFAKPPTVSIEKE